MGTKTVLRASDIASGVLGLTTGKEELLDMNARFNEVEAPVA